MRILISTDTVGGVWDHTVSLAGGLHAAGHDVLLAVLGEPRDSRLAALPAGVEVTWRRYRLEWMPDSRDDVAAAGAWLRETAGVWQADVAHLNQMGCAAGGLGVPTLVAVHSDVLSWYDEVMGGPPPPDEWLGYARRARAGIAAADAVAAPTRYQAELVRRHFGAGAVHVVHNGTAPPAAPPTPTREPVVLSVGRGWDAAKGMHVLDAALARLGDAAPRAYLLGELRGPHGQRFEPRCLQPLGRVERAEVDRRLGRAAIYVGASLYEPFGLAPLEAALHGAALVLSDVPSFRELWHGCARFFPRGDSAALAAAIAALGADERARSVLAGAARTRALRRYTVKHMVDGYLALYRQLAAGRQPTPLESTTCT